MRTLLLIFILSGFFSCEKNEREQYYDDLIDQGCISKNETEFFKVRVDNISLLNHYDSFQRLENGLIRVVKNNKKGLLDIYGREILTCQYSGIYLNKIGLLIARKSNKRVLVFRDSTIVYYCSYESIRTLDNGNSIVEQTREDTTYYGLIDSLGREIIPPKYDYLRSFATDEQLIAEFNGKQGIINTNQEIILPFQYKRIQPLEYGKYAEIINFDERKGLVDSIGTIITPVVYEDLSDPYKTFFKAKKNGKYGFLDKKGAPLTKFEYDEITSSKYGSSRLGLYRTRIDQRYGLIHESGKTIIPPIYQNEMKYHFPVKVMRDSLWTIVNENGDEIFPPQFDDIVAGEDLMAYPALKDSKWALVSLKGHPVSNFTYDKFNYYLRKNLFKFESNGKFDLLDERGKVVISGQDSIGGYGFSKYGINVMKNGKWGTIDSLGNQIIEYKYDDLGWMGAGVAFAKSDKKYGLISHLDEVILPFTYDYIGNFDIDPNRDSTAPIRLNNKWGRIDTQGKIVVPIKFTSDEVELGF